MRQLTQKRRPKYLNLLHIKLPISGVVSIIHRISGVLLVVALPFVIYVLDLSLRDAAGFAQVAEIFDSVFIKMLLLIGIGALIHHFFAGIRFLLLDVDIGIQRGQALASAWAVVVIEIAVLGIVMVWLL